MMPDKDTTTAYRCVVCGNKMSLMAPLHKEHPALKNVMVKFHAEFHSSEGKTIPAGKMYVLAEDAEWAWGEIMDDPCSLEQLQRFANTARTAIGRRHGTVPRPTYKFNQV